MVAYTHNVTKQLAYALMGAILVAFATVGIIARADVPFTAVGSKVITVTNAATRVSVLVGSQDIGECFKLANPNTALVCLGGSGVDAATATGDDCWAVCRGGAFCAEDVTSIPYSTYSTYLRAPVNTVVTVLLGNGC